MMIWFKLWSTLPVVDNLVEEEKKKNEKKKKKEKKV